MTRKKYYVKIYNIVHVYKMIAIILTNMFIGFLFLNFISWAIIKVREDKKSEEYFPSPQWVNIKDVLDYCYPNMDEREAQRVRDASVYAKKMEYSEFIQFKIPACHISDILNIHPIGFRYSDEIGRWPLDRKAINIFFFGGSTMFGYNAPDKYTIPSFFRKYLPESLKKNVVVYNFGHPFHYSTLERILFQKLIEAGHIPDIAIFLDGLNEINTGDELKFTPRLKKIFKEQKGEPFKWGDIFKKTSLCLIIYEIHQKLQNEIKSKEALISDIEESEKELAENFKKKLGRYFNNKVMIESCAQGFGIKTLFIWQPVPFYRYDTRYHYYLYETDPSQSFKRFKIAYEMMRSMWGAGNVGDNFIWFGDIQEGIKKPLYLDFVHYGAFISEMMGGKIYQYMDNKNMIIK